MEDYISKFFKFIFGSLRRLNHIIRFNTRSKTIIETVASHSFFVAVYSLVLAKIFKSFGYEVNTGTVVVKALLHDIEECIAGDVLTSVKADPDMKAAYDKIAKFSAHTVFDVLPESIRDELYSEWLNEDKNSLEWFIVELSDELSGIVYCREQILMGNKFFIPIYKNYLERFKNLLLNSKFSFVIELFEKKYDILSISSLYELFEKENDT